MEAPAVPPTPASAEQLPRNVKVLGAASLLNDIASEMIFPLLPAFLKSIGGTLVDLGLIEGVADSIASLLKLWSGSWSDRLGKRKGLVLVGYTMSALTRPLVAVLTAPWQLFAVRSTERVGKGIRTAPRDALIADSTAAGMHGRAFGFHRAMDHLGAAIGPLLAAGFLWLWPGEYRTLFLLTLLPGLAVLALLLFGLREQPPAAQPQHRQPMPWTLRLFDWPFRLYLLALVIFTLGNSSDAFLIWRASELGVPLEGLPLLWAAFHMVKSAGNWLAGAAVDRIGSKPMIVVGWLVYAGIYLAFALATEAWHVWVFFLAYAVFYSLTEPAEKTLVARLVGSERKGLAYGWFHFAIGIATLPASVLFGYLYKEYGALVAFSWSAALVVIAAALLVGVRENAGNQDTR